jgi:hypothetical protein
MWVIMIGERYTWREIESPMDYSTLRRRFWSYLFALFISYIYVFREGAYLLSNLKVERALDS